MKKLKSENGVITFITLVTILFTLSFLLSSYVIVANKVKTQKEMLMETKKIYEPTATMEEIYKSYISNDEVIPIHTVEELLKIGETYSDINGKHYINSENTTYVLMNDLEFSAIELGLQSDWSPIDENPNFIGKFEWNKHRIDVTTLNKNVNIYNGKTVITKIAYENLLQDASEEIKNAVDEGKIDTVLKETINETPTLAVVPTGYEVSKKYGEYALSEGLVISDGGNEFVWIPVGTEFIEEYDSSDGKPLESSELTMIHSNTSYAYDSQETLDYYYGEGYYTYPQTEEEKNDVNNSFAYRAHYKEMVTSVNKYNGFYIGRYETTIDEQGSIGTKWNTKVLTADSIIKPGENANDNNNPYYYRWWGLYDAQRNSNIKGNKDYVQVNMIWGQQWDAMLDFLGEEQKASKISGSQSQVLKSGEATYDFNLKDKMNNIYDLRRNGNEWTAEAGSEATTTNYRVSRSGNYGNDGYQMSASWIKYPNTWSSTDSSRVTLYIK